MQRKSGAILNLVWMEGQKHIPTAVRCGVDETPPVPENHIPTAVKSGVDGSGGSSEAQKRSGTPFGMPPFLLLFFDRNILRDACLVEVLFQNPLDSKSHRLSLFVSVEGQPVIQAAVHNHVEPLSVFPRFSHVRYYQ